MNNITNISASDSSIPFPISPRLNRQEEINNDVVAAPSPEAVENPPAEVSDRSNRVYNFIFHPNHSSHTPFVRVAAIVTGLVLTILTCSLFLCIFTWRRNVDAWNAEIEAIPLPEHYPEQVFQQNFISEGIAENPIRKDILQLRALENREIRPRLLQVLNALHLNGIISSEKALFLKSAAHHLHTVDGIICFGKLCEELLQDIDDPEARCYLSQILHNGSHPPEKFLELVYLNHYGFSFQDYFLDDETSLEQEFYFRRVIKEHSLNFLDNFFNKNPAIQNGVRNRDDKEFRIAVIADYEKQRDQLDPNERVQSLFIEELQDKISSYEGDIFLELATILQGKAFYDDFINKLSELVKSDAEKDVDEMISLHQYTRSHLQGLSDLHLDMPRYRSLVIGMFTRIFREIDDQLGHHHILCGCHIKKDPNINENRQPEFFDQPRIARAVHPQINECPNPVDIDSNEDDYPFLGKAFGIIPARIGAGHITPGKAVEKRIADKGGHVYFTDGPEDLLLDLDPAYQFSWISNYLSFWPVTSAQFLDEGIKYERYFLLSLAKKFFDQEETPADIDSKTELLIRGFLQRGLDFVVPLYQRHAPHMAKAAEDLGNPTLLVGTDLWDDIPGWKPPEPESRNQLEHFRYGLMLKDHYPNDKLMQSEHFQIEDGVDENGEKRIKKLFRDEQLVELGFPVHEAFFKKGDEEETRENYGVDPNARVIVIMSAGAGIKNDYPEMIRNEFRDVDGPLHVFVLCGSNADELDRHTRNLTAESESDERPKVESKTKKIIADPVGNLAFTILPRIESPEVAALMRLTKQPVGPNKLAGLVVSLKAGGGTFSELATIGARVAVKTGTPWEWEKENAKCWAEALGMGVTFESDEEMWSRVKLVLDTQYPIDPENVDHAKKPAKDKDASLDLDQTDDEKEPSKAREESSIVKPKSRHQLRMKKREAPRPPRSDVAIRRPPQEVPLRGLVNESQHRMQTTIIDMFGKAEQDAKLQQLRKNIWKPLMDSDRDLGGEENPEISAEQRNKVENLLAAKA